MKMRTRSTLMVSGVIAGVVGWAGSAFATTDSNLTGATGQITDYFSANIGVVIALFVAVSALLWLLGMAFRSVGVKKASKVG
jgi:hypothetical protein